MQRNDEVYVGHMLDLSRKVAAKIAGVRREKFDEDENLRLALAHLLQTIGEAARRVSREFQKAHPEIPWGGGAPSPRERCGPCTSGQLACSRR